MPSPKALNSSARLALHRPPPRCPLSPNSPSSMWSILQAAVSARRNLLAAGRKQSKSTLSFFFLPRVLPVAPCNVRSRPPLTFASHELHEFSAHARHARYFRGCDSLDFFEVRAIIPAFAPPPRHEGPTNRLYFHRHPPQDLLQNNGECKFRGGV